MDGYDASAYGDRIADVYDDWHSFKEEETPDTVALLAELAGGGPALELAVGTGRVALPLAGRGVDVHGIDASEAMIAKLRAKPGGERLPVSVGDLADVAVDGPFRLVYLLFNTLFALPSQDEQARCFRNVAARLTGDGVFVVEAFVPDVTRYVRGEYTGVRRLEADGVMLHLSRHDPVCQVIETQLVALGAGGIRLQPVRLRYAWPAELDLMARLAGLRLLDRWGGWRREPFTAASPVHVSVYGAS